MSVQYVEPLSASSERLGGAQGAFLCFKGLHLGSTEKRKNPLAALKFCLPSLRLSPLLCVCRVWVATGGVKIGSQTLRPHYSVLVPTHQEGILHNYDGTNMCIMYICTNAD